MANCKECDRCGVFYKHYETEDNSECFYNGKANSMCFCYEACVGGSVYTKTKTIDLCPKCFGDLIRFLNGADVKASLYSGIYTPEVEKPTTEDENDV